MDFPLCPACEKGHLLPLSGNSGQFSFWVCSRQACPYVVSSSNIAVTFYKGSALQQEKDKWGKKWAEFSF
jgi:hypothetical protein